MNAKRKSADIAFALLQSANCSSEGRCRVHAKGAAANPLTCGILSAMGTNAELLRQGHAAYIAGFESGDPSNLLSLLDPAVEWQTGAGIMEGAYHAHEGVRRWMREFWESWEELQLKTEEVVEGGEGRVFGAARIRGRGRASGALVEGRFYEVVEIRNGLITRRLAFSNRESALKAAGLSEEHVRAAS